MKILLVQPPSVPGVIGGGVFYVTEPLALETIAAPLSDHEVRILDLRLDDDLPGVLDAFDPDIVGVTCLTVETYRAREVLREARARNPGVLTIAGGQHASLMPHDFDLPYVDLICLGEGVDTLQEVVEAALSNRDFSAIKGLAVREGERLHFTPPRPPRQDLDAMPFPARQHTQAYRHPDFRGTGKPKASMMTSRGCPYRCRFCAVWKTEGGDYRVRSPQRVLEEIQMIAEPFISISDDNFLHRVDRARLIAEMVLDWGISKKFKLVGRADTIVRHPDLVETWRAAGMEIMLVGFEAFRDQDLKNYNKKTTALENRQAIRILHDLGVTISAHFIVDPDFGEADFDALGDYVEEMELAQPVFCILTPLPGTDLYEERQHEITTGNYERFDLSHAVLPTRLPLPRFYERFIDLYKRAYLRSGMDEDASCMSRDVFSSVLRSFEIGLAQPPREPSTTGSFP
jgi:radical SAM superfamily enzyme YgiQ (UPF0313 family)